VSVNFHQALAFALSGAIAGLFGGLEAFQSFTLFPASFGFPAVIAALSYVVLGGRRSVAGPIAGAAILLALPEISRPLADYRMALYGAILMLVIAFMPRGIVDTALLALRRRRVARLGQREAVR
jgi:branched-chain amino acid transport system permease protein